MERAPQAFQVPLPATLLKGPLLEAPQTQDDSRNGSGGQTFGPNRPLSNPDQRVETTWAHRSVRIGFNRSSRKAIALQWKGKLSTIDVQAMALSKARAMAIRAEQTAGGDKHQGCFPARHGDQRDERRGIALVICGLCGRGGGDEGLNPPPQCRLP
jgi:hypothetical protein